MNNKITEKYKDYIRMNILKNRKYYFDKSRTIHEGTEMECVIPDRYGIGVSFDSTQERENFDKTLNKIPEVATALHLLNSMVLSGEDHSEQSERIYKNAKEIINQLIKVY